MAQRQRITIGAGEIEELVYRNTPVVTFEQIAEVHGVSVKTVRSSYREHAQRFQDGKHVYRLDFTEANQILAGQVSKANPNGLLVFTEAGYLLLVKPMRDDTAWQVQEMMIEAYFRAKKGEQREALTHGEMLVQMAVAYAEQEKKIKMIEAQQKQDQLAIIQSQQDMLALQREMLETKDQALLAIQSMQWVTIRQYVEIYRMHRTMHPPVQRAYATWLTTYCQERGFAMYKAATADKDWPYEKTYCIAVIGDTLTGWLTRYGNSAQEPLPQP